MKAKNLLAVAFIEYSKAFGGSAWIGIGDAIIYSGKKNGPYFDLYTQMIADVRTTVQGIEVVLINERNISHIKE